MHVPNHQPVYNVVKTIINNPPVITINRCYKPFPNGWFKTLFEPHYTINIPAEALPACENDQNYCVLTAWSEFLHSKPIKKKVRLLWE